MSKYTPGPWSVYIPGSAQSTYGIDGPAREPVVWYGKSQKDGIRSLDDASLIAAAPDLLEVCKEYVSLMAYTEPMDVDSWKAWRNEHFQRVRAAIAKAEGVDE